MGSLAASGGYYVSMPADHLIAEESTMTGSIGVYASLLNISGLAEQYKVGMITFKAGQIKDSGSPFNKMTAKDNPKEMQVWQDMVNTAYLQFLGKVEKGREGKLKKKLREEFLVKPVPSASALSAVRERPVPALSGRRRHLDRQAGPGLRSDRSNRHSGRRRGEGD